MTIHCSNKSKAVVTLNFKDGAKEVITSNHPAVEITLKEGKGVATKEVYLRGLAFSGGNQCKLIPNHEELYCTIPVNTSVSLYQLSGGTCDNGTSKCYGITNCSGGAGTEWRVGSVSIREQLISGCQIQIQDESGVIYSKSISDICPTYKVSCDDECPPGYCKCECINYPGYCCYDKNGNPL